MSFKDLPEGQTHYCEACEHEARGHNFLSAAVGHTCGAWKTDSDDLNNHAKPLSGRDSYMPKEKPTHSLKGCRCPEGSDERFCLGEPKEKTDWRKVFRKDFIECGDGKFELKSINPNKLEYFIETLLAEREREIIDIIMEWENELVRKRGGLKTKDGGFVNLTYLLGKISKSL